MWRYELPSQGIGGVAATQDFVIVSSRDASDKSDLFVLLDAESGIPLWELRYLSDLSLDYGNSPRVVPLLTETKVYCLGAQGWLHCLDIESGAIRWKRHMVDDLGGKQPQWGYASSPILIDNQLIVQPGGLEAGWVALDPKTGKVLWKTNGRPAAYASPIAIEYRGQKQFIGYDNVSLGGWSPIDGQRLWEMKPEIAKDFNVPTPLIVHNKIFVVTENNGARLYSIAPSMEASDANHYKFNLTLDSSTDLLTGDSQSPVRVGKLIAGVDRDLVVLDPADQLREVARFSDPVLQGYCTLIAESNRVWICTGSGTQLLLTIDSNGIQELGRFQAMEEAGEIFAHPAICNGSLYLRGPTWIDAYSLAESKP